MSRVAVAVLFAALALGGCLKKGVARSGPAKAPATVRIGALLPLSGKKAPMGMQQRRAFQLAEEHINSDSEIKVKFIFVDTKSDPKVGETGARKLIEQERLSVVFAFPCAIVYKAQPIADKVGTLLMACNMDPRTAEASPLTFRLFPTLRQQTDEMLKYLDKGDGKRAVVIHLKKPSPDYAVNKLLVPGLKAQGWQVAANATYNKKNRNYKAVVAQVKASNPDVILMYVDKEAVPPLLKLLKQRGLSGKAKILGGINFVFPFKLPAEILEGVIVVAPACAMSARPRVKATWFGREFLRRYGKPPHFFATFCFDGAVLLGHALKENGTSVAGVQAYLKTVKDHAGVTGSITFNDVGDVDQKWEVGVYMNGKLTPIAGKK
jgi:branched-chain amino acid transport system substrate-binding protein